VPANILLESSASVCIVSRRFVERVGIHNVTLLA
jgi:hypothetical protein